MTTLTFPTITTPGRSGRRTSVLGFFRAVWEGVREGNAIADRYQHMSRLPDRELAKLGLTRMEVPQAAVLGVKGL